MRQKLAIGAPANFAFSREDKRDGFLAAMVMHSRPRARLDFESATPERGCYSKLRRDSGTTLRAGSLRGSEIELGLTIWIALISAMEFPCCVLVWRC
jgi:hypothetical protein